MNCSGLYRLAEEEEQRCATLPGHYDDTFAAGAVWGAVCLAVFIGMAEAIRQNYGPSPFSAYLKERVAAEGRARGGWETPPISDNQGDE